MEESGDPTNVRVERDFRDFKMCDFFEHPNRLPPVQRPRFLEINEFEESVYHKLPELAIDFNEDFPIEFGTQS